MNSVAFNNNNNINGVNNFQLQQQIQMMTPQQQPQVYNNNINMFNRGMQPVAYPNPYYSQPPPPPPGFGMGQFGSGAPPPPPGYAQAMMSINLNQPTF
jgi:hypothetical protein